MYTSGRLAFSSISSPDKGPACSSFKMDTPRNDVSLFPRSTETAFSKDLTFARLCDLKFPLEIKVYVRMKPVEYMG